VSHLVGADVEAESRPVAVVVCAPMQHPAAVRPLPVIQLRVGCAFGAAGRKQWHGALGIGPEARYFTPLAASIIGKVNVWPGRR